MRITSRTRDVRIPDHPHVTLDLTPLAKAPRLRALHIGSDVLTSLSLEPLRDKPIERLGLVVPAIVALDLSPIAASATLDRVSLYPGRAPLDLTPLAGCRALTYLFIESSATELDLGPLDAVPMLQDLDLRMPELRSLDVRPLANLPELRQLGIIAPRLARIEVGTTPGFEALIELALLEMPLLRQLDIRAFAPGRWLRTVVLPKQLEEVVDAGKLGSTNKRFRLEFRADGQLSQLLTTSRS